MYVPSLQAKRKWQLFVPVVNRFTYDVGVTLAHKMDNSQEIYFYFITYCTRRFLKTCSLYNVLVCTFISEKLHVINVYQYFGIKLCMKSHPLVLKINTPYCTNQITCEKTSFAKNSVWVNVHWVGLDCGNQNTPLVICWGSWNWISLTGYFIFN